MSIARYARVSRQKRLLKQQHNMIFDEPNSDKIEKINR